MKQPIILIGGGGHCKSCIDVIEQEGSYEIIGIVDVIEKIGEYILNYRIMGSDVDLPILIDKYKNVLITVGQIKSADIRIKLYKTAKELNANFPIIVSPLANVSRHAVICEGTIIMHHVLVNAEAQVGVNTIINSKALIEHEAKVGNHCHVSTGVNVNGQVFIGDECFIGSGVILANNISITDKVIVAAGSTVYKNIVKPCIYIKR